MKFYFFPSLPAVKFAGFLKRLRFRIDIFGRLAERTKAKKSNQTQGDILKSGTSQVRILHLPQTPRVVQRANPVSRQKHLLRSLRTVSSQGASLYVTEIETASKETDKLKEWK